MPSRLSLSFLLSAAPLAASVSSFAAGSVRGGLR